MRFQIVTIFPDFFSTPLEHGLLDKAIDADRIVVDVVNLRQFAKGRHRQTDDAPYGGGPGMVMMPEPLVCAIDHAKKKDPDARVIALSPGGRRLTDRYARQLARDNRGLILLCGRYEGIDQRIIDHYCDEEISIGDFVLTGGEPAALVLIDAVSRMLPGVVGDPESVDRDSFKIALAPPQYTQPRSFEGHSVPAVLTSGDHAKIESWRRRAAQKRTSHYRPKLLIDLARTDTWLVIVRGENSGTNAVETIELQQTLAVAEAFELAGVVFVCPAIVVRDGTRAQIDSLALPSDRGTVVAVKRSLKDAENWVRKRTGKTPLVIGIKSEGNAEDASRLKEKLVEEGRCALLTIAEESTRLPQTAAEISIQAQSQSLKISTRLWIAIDLLLGHDQTP